MRTNPRCIPQAPLLVTAILVVLIAPACQRLRSLHSLRHDCPAALLDGQVPWPAHGTASERADCFFQLAQSLSRSGDSRSVDYYYHASALSWRAMNEADRAPCLKSPTWDTYQASLYALISDAIRFQRFDDCGRLRIVAPSGPLFVPIKSNTLDWPIEQLRDWQLPAISHHRKLKRYHTQAGLGVPIIAMRSKPMHQGCEEIEKFFPEPLPVAATAVLNQETSWGLDGGTEGLAEDDGSFVIELIDPLRVTHIPTAKGAVPIARDLSAPLEHQLQNRPINPFVGFLVPGSGNQDDGLRWAQPYQPGKIPIVFIHGLLSEPTVWLEMVNQLRMYPWFNEHYQVWAFGYATGSPFVTSAMRLREQCREAIAMVDPHGEDPALSQTVLIGHSMGGLLAKLQVVDSQDQIWRSIANVPFENVCASADAKQELQRRLFFNAQPHVKRVIYIATPHQGSSFASRGLGRFASTLVHPNEQNRLLHDQLIRNNPSAFTGTFRKRIPTSIDLLQPDDCTLQTIYNLTAPYDVRQHTILGTGNALWTLGLNDGVVPVSSARHPSAETEQTVAASHTKILAHEATIVEVTRLLKEHLIEATSNTKLPEPHKAAKNHF